MASQLPEKRFEGGHPCRFDRGGNVDPPGHGLCDVGGLTRYTWSICGDRAFDIVRSFWNVKAIREKLSLIVGVLNVSSCLNGLISSFDWLSKVLQ